MTKLVQMANPFPTSGAILLCLLSAVFSLPMLLSAAQAAQDWWRAQRMVAISGDVVQLGLVTCSHAEGGTYHRQYAEFAYHFNGATYRSTRVSFDHPPCKTNDNYQSLLAAKMQGRPVPLWIDPQHPEYAVFDRHVSWDNAIVALFGTFFLAGAVVIMRWTCWAWLVRRCVGDPELHMTHSPHIGMANFAAQIRFVSPLGQQDLWPKSHYDIQVECRCKSDYAVADGGTKALLWSDTRHYPQLPHGTIAIDMVLDLPGDLPPSGQRVTKDDEVVWQLVLKIFGGEVEFDLLVGPG